MTLKSKIKEKYLADRRGTGYISKENEEMKIIEYQNQDDESNQPIEYNNGE